MSETTKPYYVDQVYSDCATVKCPQGLEITVGYKDGRECVAEAEALAERIARLLAEEDERQGVAAHTQRAKLEADRTLGQSMDSAWSNAAWPCNGIVTATCAELDALEAAYRSTLTQEPDQP